jgi:hypothetical protein
VNTKAKWTFAAYLAGDNNLSDAGERDLLEMRRVGSNPNINVVVEFDRSGPNRDTVRYHIQKDGLNEQVEALGETDCGDPKVLLDFISWVDNKFPAEHYALILWNHGGGWEPSEIDRIAGKVGAVSYGKAEGSERSRKPIGRSLFRSTLEEVMQCPTVRERAICCDDGTGHSLDTVELGKVLKDANTILNQPIDVLGMDACLMSNLEVAYQAQPFVKYIVASEESEPNDGWPYDTVLDPLLKNPDMSPEDLAHLIVNAYNQYYISRSNTWPVTQTALDLSHISELVSPLDILSDLLINSMPAARGNINSVQYECLPFWDGTLFDIAEFCTYLSNYFTDPAIVKAASDTRSALQPGNDHLIMNMDHHGTDLDECAGLSIYLPERRRRMRISPYYSTLEFAKQHHWLSMLKAYHA